MVKPVSQSLSGEDVLPALEKGQILKYHGCRMLNNLIRYLDNYGYTSDFIRRESVSHPDSRKH